MKSTLIAFCLVDLENKKFDAENVIDIAMRRYIKRVQTISIKRYKYVKRQEARKEPIRPPGYLNRHLTPYSTLDVTPDPEWLGTFKTELEKREIKLKPITNLNR